MLQCEGETGRVITSDLSTTVEADHGYEIVDKHSDCQHYEEVQAHLLEPDNVQLQPLSSFGDYN